jgi:hypothetical protein
MFEYDVRNVCIHGLKRRPFFPQDHLDLFLDVEL